jgi:hypothetical protein
MTAAVCLADGNVSQKTQVHFGGALGGIINVFGGKSTHEGLESTTIVKGNRKLTTTGGSGELVDLDQEKIYQIDFERKTYKVVTFEELRKQFEEARKQSEASAKKEKEKEPKGEKGPEYEVDFDVRDTGKKETINGFNTHEVISTVTVREKGKKLEQSGGVVLTSDMWIGPQLSALDEIGRFDRKYFQKLYGSLYSGAEMQQMAVLMATNPAFAKAMKAFGEKKASFNGTPIRTTLTVESVAGAEQKQQAAKEEQPTSVSGAVFGGLMKKVQQRRQEKSGGDPNRSRLFDSTNEILKASTAASASDVALPAGFKQKS